VTRILDRYLLREWIRIFLVSAFGLPLMVILIQLTENLDRYLGRDIGWQAIALGYFFSLPERVFQILPAAVLFATVFSIVSMARHSELTAAKASGVSARRTIIPVLLAATVAAGMALVLGELAPPATRRQLELLGELEQRAQSVRYNFVYRAERGWVYSIRELHVPRQRMQDVILEREGTGSAYPTLSIQARTASYDSTSGWMLRSGRFRIIPGTDEEWAFAFDSMRVASLVELPEALLIEPKKPEEMGYRELDRYVSALERSGGDGRQLRVDLALKIAIPVTCIIIAIFAAPLVVGAPRGGNAFGVAVALPTAIVFLVLVQLSRTLGSGGLIPPTVAAWLPNMAFAALGLYLMRRAPT